MIKNIFIIVFLFAFFSAFLWKFQAMSQTNENFCLAHTYNIYKKNFMTKDGRIVDYDKEGITTSEGQSYMMLRSLIMEDKKTFDLTYKWTKNNLQREDYLFAWLWGKKGLKYEIIDENSASDADIDIAFALYLAYEKWQDEKYLKDAKLITNVIWKKETKKIGNYILLTPGAKQSTEDKNEINPSYFSPYQFKIFQKYDTKHKWELLVDSSYYYLNKLSFETETGLPPNWFYIQDGQIVLEDSEKSDFSYDAIRVFLRIYLDYKYTKDPRALSVLERTSFFVNEWNKNQTFYTNYTKNGDLRNNDVFIGGVAILLPALGICNEQVANEVYSNIIAPKIQDKNYWSSKKDYYEKNLTWFGMYLYQKDFKGCDIRNK